MRRLYLIPDFLSHIDKIQDSWCLRNFNQDSIPSHHFELDRYQTFNKLTSFYFNEIEFEHESDSNPQLCDFVPNFESMLTLISLPDLEHIIEPTIIPAPINLEHDH